MSDYKHEMTYVYDAESQTFNELSNPPQTLFADIAAFHEKFSLEYGGLPRVLPEDLAKFRIGFMAEELGEYCLDDAATAEGIPTMFTELIQENAAPQNIPLDKQLDALVDLVYVALGTAYLQGFNFNEAWRRVHEANMKKVRALRAVDSARGSTYDVIKPDGWQAPDLSDLVSVT
jgi:predicted HAD superfamily Cof-like phosphohydrolase